MSNRKENKDDYFSGSRRYKDNATGMYIVNVHAGDCFVTSAKDEVAATVLGSCISACIRDPATGVGGMNHFLLPNVANVQGDSSRFGAYAMEQLINEILKRGGIKEKLEIKIFGGGNVIESSAMIGTKNIEFVKEYLANEGLKIASEDVGGTLPRKVRYVPSTGKAMIMRIKGKENLQAMKKEEEKYQKAVAKPEDTSGDVELF